MNILINYLVLFSNSSKSFLASTAFKASCFLVISYTLNCREDQENNRRKPESINRLTASPLRTVRLRPFRGKKLYAE